MSLRSVLIAAAVLAAFFFLRGPSPARIASQTVISPEAGTLEYRGVHYEAEWGEPVTRTGDIRLIDRAKYKSAPFFTHHAVLTTGDFSDPSRVKLGDSGGGSFYWTAKEQPEGTILALHFVPQDEIVVRVLEALNEGDTVTLIGRDEVNGEVKGSDGSFLRLRHDNHKYVLLQEVRFVEG